MRLRCKNCKKINNFSERPLAKKGVKLQSVCYWCKQHVPSRQGKKSHREKNK